MYRKCIPVILVQNSSYQRSWRFSFDGKDKQSVIDLISRDRLNDIVDFETWKKQEYKTFIQDCLNEGKTDKIVDYQSWESPER